MPSEVNWYGDDVALVIEGIAEEALLQMAYQIEAEAKIEAPVDTGFLRNSIYVHSKRASTFRHQSNGDHYETIGSPPAAENGVVVVGAGALYAVYAEMRRSFLYVALQRMQRQFGGIIQSVARGQL